jgi:hypothetical protein
MRRIPKGKIKFLTTYEQLQKHNWEWMGYTRENPDEAIIFLIDSDTGEVLSRDIGPAVAYLSPWTAFVYDYYFSLNQQELDQLEMLAVLDGSRENSTFGEHIRMQLGDRDV